MNMPLFTGIIAAIIIVYSIINAVDKSKHPIKKSLLGVTIGLAALTAVNLAAPFTGTSIPVSVLSVLTAAAGGLPGVTLLLCLNVFF